MVDIKLFIFLHLIISTLSIWFFYNKNKSRMPTIASTLIILIFPIGGVIIVYLLYLMNLDFLSLSSEYDFRDYFEGEKQEFRFVKSLNVAEETKIIPIQKALIEEDILKRREAVLNLIKKDVNDYTSLMNMALINDDSETSHYAASSILHSKRKLDNNMNKISELYKRDKDDPVIMVEYADQLVEFINNGYVDNSAKVKYIEESINILKQIVNDKIDLDNRHIFNLINILLKTENLKTACKYTKILMENYPDSEEKYLLILKVLYMSKDYDNFNIALENFTSSDIKFSKEAIDIVRFWLEA